MSSVVANAGAASRLSLHPGGLINRDESVEIKPSVEGELTIRRGVAGGFSELERVRLTAGESRSWTAPGEGMFLLEFTDAAGETLRRPLAVVSEQWAVCQITVGAFTAEDFANQIHEAGLAADYYVGLPVAGEDEAFTACDPRWTWYERQHGDAIHPHAMAEAFGVIDPALAHDNPNWESLPLAGIEARLKALQSWWLGRGYAPLDRIATYTPSNLFVRACRATGIRVVHSLCPEQNWSDGEWAINHWGMPTAPFWIAPDDFRKAGARDAQGVLGITMNHYQVLLPHLTHWGDFVLSPSHFTRWNRAADSGDESTRFRQFLLDTVRGGTSLTGAPFFFVAGFEFGRTFGTANMTEWNRAGLARLIGLASTERLAFATSGDVRAYHDRHVPGFADRVFRQRDNWVGVTVNGKPGQAGDSVVIERSDYKALIREGAATPYFYYDYTAPWYFKTDDLNAPTDFATDCAAAVSVTRIAPDRAVVEATTGLARPVPIAFWDAETVKPEFHGLPVRMLDDGRMVAVLEVPAGWHGRVEIKLSPHSPPAGRRDGRWIMQTFGEGIERHTYLHLDAALVSDVRIPVILKKTARVDDAQRSLGELPAGTHMLTFGPLLGWYRVWGLDAGDIEPAADVDGWADLAGALLPSADLMAERMQSHRERLDAAAWSHPAMRNKRRVFAMHCGAELALGTRSRASGYDRPTAYLPGVSAREFSDGVIAFGPGKSFWYHPRGLHFRIDGLPGTAGGNGRWTVLLHGFDPTGTGARHRLQVGPEKRDLGVWIVPEGAEQPEAFRSVEISERDIDAQGRVVFHMLTDQTPLVRWWSEGGFIAGLHALWVAAGGENAEPRSL